MILVTFWSLFFFLSHACTFMGAALWYGWFRYSLRSYLILFSIIFNSLSITFPFHLIKSSALWYLRRFSLRFFPSESIQLTMSGARFDIRSVLHIILFEPFPKYKFDSRHQISIHFSCGLGPRKKSATYRRSIYLSIFPAWLNYEFKGTIPGNVTFLSGPLLKD